MFYKKMDLQLFEDGAGVAPGNQGGNAEVITTVRRAAPGRLIVLNRQKRSPMPGHSVRNRQLCAPYFQQQGMTQEEVTQALTQFKQQREAQKPNVSLIEKERDEARRELEAYRQKDILKNMVWMPGMKILYF